MSSGSVTLPQTGSGSGGITSINADTTAAQVISGGTGISVATVAGTTTITNTAPVSNPVSIANGGFGISGAATTVATSGVIASLPVATNFIRMTSATNVIVQGIANNGTAQRVTIYAVTARVTFLYQNVSASAPDRIILPGASPTYIVYPNNSATFIYDTVQQRWVLTTTQLVPEGTTNQVNVSTDTTGFTTLSLPQDIATSSFPSFSGINNSGAVSILDLNNGRLFDESAVESISFQERHLKDTTANNILDWSGSAGVGIIGFIDDAGFVGAQAGTLTNAPAIGNPAGYLSVTVNGVLSYIPYWQR